MEPMPRDVVTLLARVGGKISLALQDTVPTAVETRNNESKSERGEL